MQTDRQRRSYDAKAPKDLLSAAALIAPVLHAVVEEISFLSGKIEANADQLCAQVNLLATLVGATDTAARRARATDDDGYAPTAQAIAKLVEDMQHHDLACQTLACMSQVLSTLQHEIEGQVSRAGGAESLDHDVALRLLETCHLGDVRRRIAQGLSRLSPDERIARHLGDDEPVSEDTVTLF